jgi:hypothetical protein
MQTLGIGMHQKVHSRQCPTHNQYFTKIELKRYPKTGVRSLRRRTPVFGALLFRDLLIIKNEFF